MIPHPLASTAHHLANGANLASLASGDMGGLFLTFDKACLRWQYS